jgi:D-serine deaminase-like pyridoxal phosphate-dependent protein
MNPALATVAGMTAVEPAATPAGTGDRARFEKALAGVDAPYAVVDLGAFWANAADLLRRAGGTPIRVASKSVRCRALLRAVLDRDPGFRGVLAFTLPEALWLSEEGFGDLVVAYPTADRGALRALGASERARRDITLMVDSVEHLDLIEAEAGAGDPPVRVCLDLDAGFWFAGGRVRAGAKRSPVRTSAQAAALAREVAARPALRLAGLMAYESQIAGVGDRPPGKPLLGRAIRWMQRSSARELAERRAAVVAAVRAVGELEFVNGGGTGSVEGTAREAAVTEIAAGSGLFAPTLFDAYTRFSPRPAAFFALPVVRRPGPGVATVLGGGYLASGPADAARLPRPVWPEGLHLDRQEGAGEVQTPVLGPAADGLRLGDLVWFRHAKAGELCERFERLHLIEGDAVSDVVPTYRGEGKTFL